MACRATQEMQNRVARLPLFCGQVITVTVTDGNVVN